MPQSTIDWGGAVVSDGTLRVPLTDMPSRAWTRSFRSVLALLDRSPGDWDEIALKRGGVTVRDVREGSEDKLRHLLESVIVEVSGDLDVNARAVDDERDSLRARDQRMTDAFRRFGRQNA